MKEFFTAFAKETWKFLKPYGSREFLLSAAAAIFGGMHASGALEQDSIHGMIIFAALAFLSGGTYTLARTSQKNTEAKAKAVTGPLSAG